MYNLLSTLKNNIQIRKYKMEIKKTKYSIAILDVLVREGFIRSFIISKTKILVLLKYINDKPLIKDIKMISKPSQRVYLKNFKLYNCSQKKVFLISTNQGILSLEDAKRLNLGGELLCFIC